MMLKPNLAMLDEIDSGLDVDAVRLVSKGMPARVKCAVNVLQKAMTKEKGSVIIHMMMAKKGPWDLFFALKNPAKENGKNANRMPEIILGLMKEKKYNERGQTEPDNGLNLGENAVFQHSAGAD